MSTATRQRLPIALYPTGLLVGSILAVYVTSSVSPYAAMRAAAVATIIGVLVTIVGTRLTGDRHRGGLVGLLVVMGLLGGAQPLVLVPLGVITTTVAWDARRAPERRLRIRWYVLTRVLTAVVGILLLAIGIKGLQDGRITDTAYDLVAEARLPWGDPGAMQESRTTPDIYLLLLDGYLRPDKQAELFGGDASGFVDTLEDRGFDVAERSRSNYIVTRFSMMSMLNMKHALDLVEEDRRGALPAYDTRYLINQSDAIEAARTHGYEIVGVSAGWEELSLREADRFIDPGFINEFEFQILLRSVVRPVLNALAPDLMADGWRSRISRTFEAVGDVAEAPSQRPRFVLAHVPSPHSPFVFGPNGERLPGFPMEQIHLEAAPIGADRASYGEAYLGQSRHLEQLTVAAIDRILAADPGAVIVLFSDHGSGAGYTPTHPADTDLDERTANLVAVRTPGLLRPLPDDVTLINVLPPILNAYLGTDFKLSAPDIYTWIGDDEFDIAPASGVPD